MFLADRSRSRLSAILAALFLVGVLPGGTLAAAQPVIGVGSTTLETNSPPVAMDDPGLDCQPVDSFGGAFPIPEDFRTASVPNDYLVLGFDCGLLKNDSDPDGDPLDWEIVDPPAHGDVIYVDPGSFAYRPAPDYSTKAGDEPGGQWVSDSFTYRACDPVACSVPATMRFWIAPINDVPTLTPGATVTVGEDSGPYSATWATDVSPGPLESDQTVHFELDGPSPIEEHATGEMFIDPPAIDGDGNLTFTLTPDVSGYALVTMVARDDGGLPTYAGIAPTAPSDDTTDPFTFQIDVTSDAVTAVDDDVTVPEDPDPAPWLVDVLLNDTYPPGATVTAVSQGTLGEVTIAPDGSAVLYAPDLNANGADTFTYTLDDGAGSTDSATVSVDITPSNDAPNAINDVSFKVPESAGPTSVAVMDNDTDVDGDTLTISGKTDGAHGNVAITGDGTGLTYDPAQLYYGTDVFTYTISDGHGESDTATVLVTIVKDSIKPAVSGPSERFYDQTVGSSSQRAHLTWAATDPGGTGIAKYQLQLSTSSGSYSTIGLSRPTATSINRTLPNGRTYRYRVRATDGQGNVSGWSYGPRFTPHRYQDTSASIRYSGRWKARSTPRALGGSARYSGTIGASASITKTAWDFAWVATRTSTSGSAQVWIDGALAATVNLRSSATTYRQVVFWRHFTTLGTHTLEIRPIGGGRIYLDAVLTFS